MRYKNGMASIYSDDFNLDIPQLTDFEIDDKVIVWDDQEQFKKLRHFAGISKNGKIQTFNGGLTSYSTRMICEWDRWELPDVKNEL